MTPERAEQIRETMWRAGLWNWGCATPEEIKAVKEFWETLPGTTTAYDAVQCLARGGRTCAGCSYYGNLIKGRCCVDPMPTGEHDLPERAPETPGCKWWTSR